MLLSDREEKRPSIDVVCGVLEGLALDYGRAEGGSSCSWAEPNELTMWWCAVQAGRMFN